jgi:predicted O-methyltransferase YrrM
MLGRLHQRLQPETYLEVGVRWGDSLTLARCTSVGIDPDFKVTQELHGPMHLERTTSDEFFARDNPLAVFDGRPVDLAFIDGMHLAEFALRDFINIERHMAPGGVVVFDDMLPRNPLEAARDRKTVAWAGDVYKVVTVLREHRPDLVVLPLNTSPTGTLVVLGLDPSSTVLDERFDELVPFLEALDPQAVPEDLLRRSTALEPAVLLDTVDWDTLRALRHRPAGDTELRAFVDRLRELPTLG